MRVERASAALLGILALHTIGISVSGMLAGFVLAIIADLLLHEQHREERESEDARRHRSARSRRQSRSRSTRSRPSRQTRGARARDDTRPERIVTALFARSTNTYWSAIELARTGCGEQALMLNRSLCEDIIDAHWVTGEPGLARERFEQDFRFSQLLLADAVGKHPEFFNTHDIQTLDQADRPNLKDIFGEHASKSWTGREIHRKVIEIQQLWKNHQDRESI